MTLIICFIATIAAGVFMLDSKLTSMQIGAAAVIVGSICSLVAHHFSCLYRVLDAIRKEQK